MYAQLDVIDMVAEDSSGPMYIQSDHRSAAEIEDDPHLAVLMTMARLLAARAHASEQGKGGRVLHAAPERPPELLCQAIAACGAELLIDHEPADLPQPTRDVDELLDEAMRFVADRVARERGLSLDEEGLIVLQRIHGAASADPNEEPAAYWTAYLELAAVGGEVVRTLSDGGCWSAATNRMASVHYVFDLGDGRRINVCGRVERCLVDGWEQGPHVLLRGLEAPWPSEGPPMLNLKTPEWAGYDVACRPLLDAGDDDDGDIPIIAYGMDTPVSFAYTAAADGDVVDLDALHAAALQTLSQVQPTVERMEVEDLDLVVVSEDYYAAEKILDVAFMTSLHTALGAPLLAASVPVKGVLLVTSALSEAVPTFAAVTRAHYDDGGSNALSSTVFLISEGAIAGRLTMTEAGDNGPPDADDSEAGPAEEEPVSEAPAEVSWWRRLLGLS